MRALDKVENFLKGLAAVEKVKQGEREMSEQLAAQSRARNE